MVPISNPLPSLSDALSALENISAIPDPVARYSAIRFYAYFSGLDPAKLLHLMAAYLGGR